MNTRTNTTSTVRNAFAMFAAAAAIATPAMAQSYISTEVPVVVQSNSGEKPQMASKGVSSESEGGSVISGIWINPRVQIADFNQNGTVDATDLYDFFLAWTNGKENADINGDGFIDASDVWFYLQIWDSVITAQTSGKEKGKGK